PAPEFPHQPLYWTNLGTATFTESVGSSPTVEGWCTIVSTPLATKIGRSKSRSASDSSDFWPVRVPATKKVRLPFIGPPMLPSTRLYPTFFYRLPMSSL